MKRVVTGSIGNVSSHDHGHRASSLLESHSPGLQRGPHDHRGLGWGELQVLLLVHRGGLRRLDRALSGSGQRPLPLVHGGGLRRLDRAHSGSVHFCLRSVGNAGGWDVKYAGSISFILVERGKISDHLNIIHPGRLELRLASTW